ncbi:hypothetical protein BB560_006352 [Smittium megazygosporum]|uniref:SAP domain-containing protein n=1 Tax=Smittium megazygosporum TaxID=133381 RepID=A0A2T9Y8N3_9FUNG|nr:hypothetical protein BB560_006352 [Smittium megazygosporum]
MSLHESLSIAGSKLSLVTRNINRLCFRQLSSANTSPYLSLPLRINFDSPSRNIGSATRNPAKLYRPFSTSKSSNNVDQSDNDSTSQQHIDLNDSPKSSEIQPKIQNFDSDYFNLKLNNSITSTLQDVRQDHLSKIEATKIKISFESIDSFRPTSGVFFEYLGTPVEKLAKSHGRSIFKLLDFNTAEIHSERKAVAKSISSAHNVSLLREYLQSKNLPSYGSKKALISRIIYDVWKFEIDISRRKKELQKYFEQNQAEVIKKIPMSFENYQKLLSIDEISSMLNESPKSSIIYINETKNLVITASPDFAIKLDKNIRKHLNIIGTTYLNINKYEHHVNLSNEDFTYLTEPFSRISSKNMQMFYKNGNVEIVAPYLSNSKLVEEALILLLTRSPKQAHVILFPNLPLQLSLIPAFNPHCENPYISTFLDRRLVNIQSLGLDQSPSVENHTLYDLSSSSNPTKLNLYDSWLSILNKNLDEIHNDSDERLSYYVELGNVFSFPGLNYNPIFPNQSELPNSLDESIKNRKASLFKHSDKQDSQFFDAISTFDSLDNISSSSSQISFLQGWISDSNTIINTSNVLKLTFKPRQSDKSSNSRLILEFNVKDGSIDLTQKNMGTAIFKESESLLLIPDGQNDLRFVARQESSINKVLDTNNDFLEAMEKIDLTLPNTKSTYETIPQIVFKSVKYDLDVVSLCESTTKLLSNGFGILE